MAKDSTRIRELTAGELSLFCEQTAMALDAGLPLYEGMETIARSQSDTAIGGVLKGVSERVTATGLLSEALRGDTAFPAFVVGMTAVGERTGRLEEVMKGLAGYYGREERMRRAVVSAISYPMVLGAAMLLIIIAMLVLVLPVFRQVLGNMGVTADSFSMRFGAALGWTVLVTVAFLLAGTGLCLTFMKTPLRKRLRSRLGRLIPAVGRLGAKQGVSRAASVMSIMLMGGCSADEALDAVPGVTDNAHVLACIEKLRAQLDDGAGFGDAVCASGLFGGMHAGMIRAGNDMGRLESVMQRVARDCETDVEDSISRLVSVIEPTLVVVLTVAIGAMLMSVMLPMLGVVFAII